MKNSKYTDILTNTGLTEGESVVYELLLEYGEMKASDVIRRSGLKRGNVYNILHSLSGRGLIEEFEKNGIAYFRSNHPTQLKKALEDQKQEIKRHETALESLLPDLVSDYNKGHNRPGVRVFEGIEGVKKALYETLNTEGEIYAYIDRSSIRDFAEEINKKYVADRKKKGVKKKILYINTPHEKLPPSDNLTESRTLSSKSPSPIEAVLEIYDTKILYITISEKHKMATVIDDERIALLHRHLFEYQWSISTKTTE